MFYHYGFRVRNVRDTMIASQIYWSGVGIRKAQKGEDRSERCIIGHGLKDVAKRLGEKVDKTEQTSNWGWYLTNNQLNYAALDSYIVIKLWKKLGRLLKEDNLIFSSMAEFGVTPIFAEMEIRGYPFDRNLAYEFINQYKALQTQILKPFHNKFPEVLWTSNAQVLQAFRQEYDSKLESVSALSLEILKDKVNDKTLIEAILDARTLSIYIAYVTKSIEVSYFDRVRTHFRQIAASGTGRSSCSSSLSKKAPDTGQQLQNPANLIEKWQAILPKPRDCFVAPDGYNILIIDLSQAHQRIACELSKDKALTDIYNQNRDAHTLLGKTLAEIDGYKWTEEEMVSYIKLAKKGSKDPIHLKASSYRQFGKTGNYSQLNQGGVDRVVAAMKEQGINATKEEAKAIQIAWRSLYKDLYSFIKRSVQEANSHNVSFNIETRFGTKLEDTFGVIRGLTGRRQFLTKEKSRFGSDYQVNYTDTISTMWLNAEADMIKEFMSKAQIVLDNNPHYEGEIINMCHDQVDFLVKAEKAVELANILGNLLKQVQSVWIKTIPTEEPNIDYKSFICKSMGDK